MASGMSPIPPMVLSGIKTADDRKPEPRKNTSAKWWSPLFGFSSEPDYINPDAKQIKPETKPARSRFDPGLFTEEKARQLRRMTSDATSSHDMYHSAIASRLATDFPNRDFND